ncbi:hypothetical protein GWI33_021563 [Rhynchophorus ferrugineus]|uniref:Uncharacterized protein n=1 Tax=Rhynchophorus ferrugineus TaxID=354439 RepID=A0A834MLP5_RHYFE|nr:hypothetical protein GWI33_021563 [Rhynchophorus ferrugineus]
MTVNDFKETACARVQPVVDDMEVEGEVVISHHLPDPQEQDENLLGRVLEATESCSLTEVSRSSQASVEASAFTSVCRPNECGAR